MQHDIHLSAFAIEAKTVQCLERFGMCRDSFCNNTRCDTTVYHGTYRGASTLPSDALWAHLTDRLIADSTFVGTLEQESFSDTDILHVRTTEGSVGSRRPIKAMPAAAGVFKQCDIHINVALALTGAAALNAIAAVGFAAFDKPSTNGVHRVFSVTVDDVQVGMILRDYLVRWLRTLPRLSAKVKFERTDRFVRQPANAPTLPLVNAASATAWIEGAAGGKEGRPVK